MSDIEIEDDDVMDKFQVNKFLSREVQYFLQLLQQKYVYNIFFGLSISLNLQLESN